MIEPVIHGGQVIKYFRKKSKRTQTYAAKKYGIVYATLGKWERGEREPLWSHVYGVCAGLGFTAFDVASATLKLTAEQEEKRKNKY